jgi:hypothetical protein
MYVYTNELEIEDFLKEYKRSRVIIETTVRATLNRAVEFESKFGKPFYQFTTEEALEMYKSVHTVSVVSLQNNNLVLKHAARWFAFKYNKPVVNTYEEMTKDMLNAVIDVDKKKSLILSREEVDNLQSNLLNAIDKAIIEMLFRGAGGDWLKELTFMNASQVDRERLMVYFKTGKNIPITDEVCDLLIEAFAEDELMSFGSTARISKVTGHWLYKIRCNALSDNSDYNDEQAVERRYRFIQRRLLLISQDLGVRLTSGGLQSSGLLWHLQQGVEETGLTFREFVRTERVKMLAQRYDIRSDLYAQILIEKFEQYFM